MDQERNESHETRVRIPFRVDYAPALIQICIYVCLELCKEPLSWFILTDITRDSTKYNLELLWHDDLHHTIIIHKQNKIDGARLPRTLCSHGLGKLKNAKGLHTETLFCTL